MLSAVKTVAAGIVCVGGVWSFAAAEIFDLVADWSDINNPNNRWSYREGGNPLPHVSNWQAGGGDWATPQPGWADSETGNNRIPFWFKSNGSEIFPVDWIAGDVVVHTTDEGNGAGNGPGNVAWCSNITGIATVSGAVWMGRDIGRSNDWFLYKNSTLLTSGHIESGDPFSRANPFDLADGSGGSKVLQGISVSPGDTIRLEFVKTSQFGDFVGVIFTIDAAGTMTCPADLFGCDGIVGPGDLAQLLSQWGPCPATCQADLFPVGTPDGIVGPGDLGQLLSKWGQCR